MDAQESAKTVLIVDDEPDICEALELALSMEGYSVRAAHDRKAALELLDSLVPAVILLDYRMPGLNAAEFVERVRKLSTQPAIVLMTGTKDPAEQARELGIEHVLAKPFELDVMLGIVRQQTQKQQGSGVRGQGSEARD